MTENKEMKTEQEYIKIQLSDISPNPRVDYMHTLYGDDNLVGTRSIPLGQLTSCDEVVICSMYTAGNNIEDVCLINNTCKKDDNNNMTENKDLEKIKDLISLAKRMIENNLDNKETKVEQERLKNTYFKPIYTRFECEDEEELPSDIDFQVGWSMKTTVTRVGDIATTLSYKKPTQLKLNQ